MAVTVTLSGSASTKVCASATSISCSEYSTLTCVHSGVLPTILASTVACTDEGATTRVKVGYSSLSLSSGDVAVGDTWEGGHTARVSVTVCMCPCQLHVGEYLHNVESLCNWLTG